jgi:branched-chain amino acid transport system substrate-binding protein
MDKDEIKIGCSLSLTGRFAERGAPWYANAHRLWADQVNARGGVLGKLVRLVTYDDESNAERAAANYRRLIETDGIDVWLGPCHTALMGAVTPVAEASKALLVQGTHGSYADFQKGLKRQFLCWPGSDFDYPKPYLDLIAGKRTTAALVYTNGRIGQSVANGARFYAAARGITLVLDEAITDDPFDYAGLMARVKASGAEALLIGLDHGRSDEPRTSCLSAAHAAGISADTIWHSDFPVASDNKLGPANQGVHMRITWVPEIPDTHSRAFATDYKTAFGEDAEFHCAGGYACGEVLEQAAAAAGAWNADALRAAILTGTFATVCGRLKFQDNGLPESAVRLGVWQDSQLRIVAA